MLNYLVPLVDLSTNRVYSENKVKSTPIHTHDFCMNKNLYKENGNWLYMQVKYLRLHSTATWKCLLPSGDNLCVESSLLMTSLFASAPHARVLS